MFITRLKINTFRNISRSVLSIENRFNIFYGNNGQGKTNYLEAVFFLGTLKSFRSARYRDMLQWHENASSLKCTFLDNGSSHELGVSFDNNAKYLKIDDKHASRVIDYCRMLSVVAFAPEELTMISGAPEQRRRYLDRAVFSGSAEYLKTYHDYYRVLKQRNQLLKQRSYNALEAWTEQLVATGAKLSMERMRYIAALSRTFPDFYKNISGSDEEVSLCYHSSSCSEGASIETTQASMQDAINTSSLAERERGTTVIGPHRDDLEFFLNGKRLKEHASQGQQKSFVMALKMSEIDFLREHTGKEPVLLLDDMTAELDSSRIEHLMDFLLCRKMQVFITTTDPASVPLPAGADCSKYLVEEGCIHRKGD